MTKDKVEPKYTVRFYQGLDEHFRPSHVPEDFLIFNAPRPLLGSPSPANDYLGRKYFWSAKGKRGLLFAAVDPNDPNYNDLIKQNNNLHGHLCVWVTPEEVEEVVRAYYEKRWDDWGYDRPIDWDLLGAAPSQSESPSASWIRTYHNIVTGEYDD